MYASPALCLLVGTPRAGSTEAKGRSARASSPGEGPVLCCAAYDSDRTDARRARWRQPALCSSRRCSRRRPMSPRTTRPSSSACRSSRETPSDASSASFVPGSRRSPAMWMPPEPRPALLPAGDGRGRALCRLRRGGAAPVVGQGPAARRARIARAAAAVPARFRRALDDLAAAAASDATDPEVWLWRAAILLVQADYRAVRLRRPAVAPAGSAPMPARRRSPPRSSAWPVTLLAAPAPAQEPATATSRCGSTGRGIKGSGHRAARPRFRGRPRRQRLIGDIDLGQLRARHAEIAAYAPARLALRSDAAPCLARATEHLVDDHSDGVYAVLALRRALPYSVPASRIDDGAAVANANRSTRGLLVPPTPIRPRARAELLAPKRPASVSTLERTTGFSASSTNGRTRGSFLYIGIGFDHIRSCCRSSCPRCSFALGTGRLGGGRRVRAPRSGTCSRSSTAFTVAHSITLSLATLGVVTLPSRLVIGDRAVGRGGGVEQPATRRPRPALGRRLRVRPGPWLRLRERAHGPRPAAGRAGPGAGRVQPRVEIGTRARAAFPLAFSPRDDVLSALLVVGGSALIVVIAALWLVERSLDVKLAAAAAVPYTV